MLWIAQMSDLVEAWFLDDEPELWTANFGTTACMYRKLQTEGGQEHHNLLDRET